MTGTYTLKIHLNIPNTFTATSNSNFGFNHQTFVHPGGLAENTASAVRTRARVELSPLAKKLSHKIKRF
jgi:hypothetical protein